MLVPFWTDDSLGATAKSVRRKLATLFPRATVVGGANESTHDTNINAHTQSRRVGIILCLSTRSCHLFRVAGGSFDYWALLLLFCCQSLPIECSSWNKLGLIGLHWFNSTISRGVSISFWSVHLQITNEIVSEFMRTDGY